MENPVAPREVRSAILVASDPCAAVRRWKILSGRKAVGCPFVFPFPEIIHAVGMLPVFPGSGEERRALSPLMGEWARLPDPFPKGTEEALDWVESVAEWAEAVSGESCTGGALERSMRFYQKRDILTKRLKMRRDDILEPAMFQLVLDSGRFLPVEAHVMLLTGIWGEGSEDGLSMEETDSGDPLLCLARRVFAETEG